MPSAPDSLAAAPDPVPQPLSYEPSYLPPSQAQASSSQPPPQPVSEIHGDLSPTLYPEGPMALPGPS